MVGWLVCWRRFAIRRLGVWVLLPIVVLLFLGGTALYTPAAPVQPALQSYWLAIHVTAVSIASGVLLLPGVASLLYLFRAAYEKDGRFARFAAGCPTAEVLDRLAYRATIFGFPLFTFASSAARSGPSRRGAGSGAGTRRRHGVRGLGGLRRLPALTGHGRLGGATGPR